jgi:glycosyltransferase involved in cell wall biosynthesis
VVAAKAGGAVELVEDGINGFLVTPNNSQELARVINNCVAGKVNISDIANHGKMNASQRFNVDLINYKIQKLLQSFAINK